MGKTVIEIDILSEDSIDKAIKDVKKYKENLEKKCNEFCKKFAERILDEAEKGFTGAIVDDLTEKSGGAKLADVQMTISESDGVFTITANGEDAVWVEFGAGVHHNGAAGISPNPYGAELGFSIGGYGTQGVREVWALPKNPGEKVKLSRGTPATMPMYKAVQAAIDDIENIAKEVFG